MERLSELIKTRDILDKIDYKALTEILDAYLPSVPISVIDFDNRPRAFNQTHSQSNLLYRARLISNNGNKSFDRYDDITYISAANRHKITEFGRVNKPGESIFYASTESAVACIETFSRGANFNLLKEKGSLLLNVGTWKIEKPMTLARMASPEKYFEKFLEEVKSLNLRKVTIESVRKQNEEIRKVLNNDEEFKILEFFSEEFAKTEIKTHHDYKLSNYYADRIFDRNGKFNLKEKVDGVWYQSVPSSYQEINLALLTETVDTKLSFLWCDTIWVIFNQDKGNIEFIPIEQRAKVNDKGIIEWKR
jgi:hypothetical protein